jgi:putative DNA primase/helicase
VSFTDAITDFIRAMELQGIKPVEPIASRLSSGELIRFRADGDGRGRANSWAILYIDERPAGAFGNYRLGISRKWRVDRDLSLSPAERATMQREWAEAKQRRQTERDASADEACRDANEIWATAGRASADHPYLARKGIDPFDFRQAGDRLLVPMFDCDGTIRNLQRIAPDGSKRFLRGGRTDGLFFVMGRFSRRGETACIGEGVATVASIHKATGYPVIASFSAKNLPAVARLWHAARPDIDFVICGDDDAHLADNIGRNVAEAAAREIGARLAFPSREVA